MGLVNFLREVVVGLCCAVLRSLKEIAPSTSIGANRTKVNPGDTAFNSKSEVANAIRTKPQPVVCHNATHH